MEKCRDYYLSYVLIVLCIKLSFSSVIERRNRFSNKRFSRDYLADDECFHSSEATQVKLWKLFDKIKKEYYVNNRHMASTNFDYEDKEVKQNYSPFIPTPEKLKKNADAAKKYYDMLSNLDVSFEKLKPREERLIHQFKYFLNAHFDSIYNGYYDGVWMLGPDYFCEQPICFLTNYLLAAIKRMRVSSLKDLELIGYWIKEHRKSFTQYLENIKLGVRKGMVNPIEVCKSSTKTFSKIYSKVSRKGAVGATEMRFATFLFAKMSSFPKDALKEFERKENQSFKDYINMTIVNDFGEPLHELIKYLKTEHHKYCPPSDVSSGLGGLPLDYEYFNGQKQENKPTDPTLPTGEKIDVETGYKTFMRYYTTSNMSGSDAVELGKKLINQYYEQILSLAENVTGINDNQELMIKKFKEKLNAKDQYFNEKPFPENESNDEAHSKCDSDEDAQQYCPVRWSYIQKWFDYNKKILKLAKPAIRDLFYETGPKKTTPNCSVSLVAEYDPTNGVPSYLESDEFCDENASYFIPFFKDNMGPKYEDYTTNFHEARPGHHLQIQGFLENFRDECGGVSEWLNFLVDYYPSFSEGWGVYAENPLLLQDTDILKEDSLLDKYGTLKWQVWRALRLVVDVGFHKDNMKRSEAQELFKTYTWDDSDTVLKELTRYQGTPGQATSYTIGQQEILKLRSKVESKVPDSKDRLKNFHYQLLSNGQSPFDYVKSYMDKYIKCIEDDTASQYCNLILKKDGRAKQTRDDKRSSKEKEITDLFKLFKKKKHV